MLRRGRGTRLETHIGACRRIAAHCPLRPLPTLSFLILPTAIIRPCISTLLCSTPTSRTTSSRSSSPTNLRLPHLRPWPRSIPATSPEAITSDGLQNPSRETNEGARISMMQVTEARSAKAMRSSQFKPRYVCKLASPRSLLTLDHVLSVLRALSSFATSPSSRLRPRKIPS
jgi:hypothetical protein